MKILKTLLGVPAFFIVEFLARICVPLFSLFKTKKQKALMAYLAQEAIHLRILDCAEDFKSRSMLTRLNAMSVNFQHLVETAYVLADPETVYEDPLDFRRVPAEKFVFVLLQYRNTILGLDTDLVDVSTALATRRREFKDDMFGLKWYEQLIGFGMIDQYLFYIATGRCGIWLRPLNNGSK